MYLNMTLAQDILINKAILKIFRNLPNNLRIPQKEECIWITTSRKKIMLQTVKQVTVYTCNLQYYQVIILIDGFNK